VNGFLTAHLGYAVSFVLDVSETTGQKTKILKMHKLSTTQKSIQHKIQQLKQNYML